MDDPSIALVFSPEPWVEELHRHCTDHGGARVRHVVVEPRVALDEPYDTLVASHRWPALTPAFVAALHDRGRRVLGVFDVAEPAGHEHLATLGVDAIVASDAAMATFLEAIAELGVAGRPDDERTATPAPTEEAPRGRLVAVGGTSGAGATEVAIALAAAAAGEGRPVALVDADESAPSIAPRLALPIEPNLRTAIDAAVYDRGVVSLSRLTGFSRCAVLGGLPSTAGWAQVRAEEVLLVLEQLARDHDLVVANVGSHLELVGEPGRDRFGVSRAAVGVADAVVGVGAPTPLGVIRAITWSADLRSLAPASRLHLVVNRAPRDRFRRGEVVAELVRSVDAVSVDVVPEDRRVAEAAWAGRLVAAGPFTRAVGAVAARLPDGPRPRPHHHRAPEGAST